MGSPLHKPVSQWPLLTIAHPGTQISQKLVNKFPLHIINMAVSPLPALWTCGHLWFWLAGSTYQVELFATKDRGLCCLGHWTMSKIIKDDEYYLKTHRAFKVLFLLLDWLLQKLDWLFQKLDHVHFLQKRNVTLEKKRELILPSIRSPRPILSPFPAQHGLPNRLVWAIT